MKLKFYFLMGLTLIAFQSHAGCVGEGSPYNAEQFKTIATKAIAGKNWFMGDTYVMNPKSEIAIGADTSMKFSTMVVSNHITDLMPFKKSGSNDCSIEFSAQKIGGSESKIRCSILISPSTFYDEKFRKKMKAADDQTVAALYECKDITDAKNVTKIVPRSQMMPDGLAVFTKNQILENDENKNLEVNDVSRSAVTDKRSAATPPSSAANAAEK